MNYLKRKEDFEQAKKEKSDKSILDFIEAQKKKRLISMSPARKRRRKRIQKEIYDALFLEEQAQKKYVT